MVLYLVQKKLFIDNLSKIDFHGYDRETTRVLINDFINVFDFLYRE